MTAKPPVFVTGAGAGLGAAICRAFQAAGHPVAAGRRSAPDAAALSVDLGVSVDVSDAASVTAAVAQVEQTLGPIGVVVHNARRPFAMGGFLETSPETFEATWRTSCLGLVHLAQATLPGLVERGGTLLVTGATAGVRGGGRFSAFAASKFALRGLTQSLAREFGPQGVHVAHVIIDGIIWSERARDGFGLEEDAAMQPDAIAANYVHLHQQHRSAWTHELDLRPDRETF